MSKKSFIFILTIFLTLLLIAPTFASDINDIGENNVNNDNYIYVAVDGNDDSGDGSLSNPYASISKAIDMYNENNTSIYVKDGTYNFNSEIKVTKSINITGQSDAVIFNGNHQSSFFNFAKSTIYLNNIKFINSNNTYAITSSYSSLNIDHCIFENNPNTAIKFTGSTYSSSNYPLIVKNSLFNNNSKFAKYGSAGGAIEFSSGNLTIDNCTFTNNYVRNNSTFNCDGGAIYINLNPVGVIINNSKFINNSAGRNGGAIAFYYGGSGNITNCLFDNCTANNQGNAIYDNGFTKEYLALGNNQYINCGNEAVYVEGVKFINLDSAYMINAKDVSMYVGDEKFYVITLNSTSGANVSGKSIKISFKSTIGYEYNITVSTDKDGIVTIPLENMPIGYYKVNASLVDDSTVYTINTVKIASENVYNLIFDEDHIKTLEGESYIVIGNVVNEYGEKTSDLDSNDCVIMWKTYRGAIHAINGYHIENSQMILDLNRLRLVTQDELYEINFTISNDNGWGGDVESKIYVDTSVILPNFDPNLEVIYVDGKNGNDITGNGSESNPLATVQMALHVNHALNGGKTIFVKDGEYTISAFTIRDSVTIIGESLNTTFTQKSIGKNGMFFLFEGSTVKFINLSFTGGYVTPIPFGLITVDEYSDLIIENSYFYNNKGFYGGVINNNLGNTVIRNSLFFNNTADEGGVLWADSGNIDIINSTFLNNTADSGGALFAAGNSYITIWNSTLRYNNATEDVLVIGGGGAIYVRTAGKVVIYNSDISENYANIDGGAINVEESTLEVYNSTLINNHVNKSSYIKGSCIYLYPYSDSHLIVNYCIILSDDYYNARILVNDDYEEEINLTYNIDNNYWGRNSNPSVFTDVNNISSWVVIKSNVDEELMNGTYYEIIFEFASKDRNTSTISELDKYMPKFPVDIKADLGQLDVNNITFYKNIAKVNYFANIIGKENITLTYNDKIVYVLSFDVDKYVERTNVSISASDFITYYHSNSNYAITLVNENGTGIANENIIFTIGDKISVIKTDENGTAYIPIDLDLGNYKINIVFKGSKAYFPNETTKTINVLTTISGSDLTKYYGSDFDYLAILLDKEGKPLINKDVNYLLNSKQYTGKTDSEGNLVIKTTDLPIGQYELFITNPETQETLKNNIVVLSTLETNDLTKYYKNDSQFEAKFLDFSGKPLANTEIKFIISGMEYTRTTNANGIAIMPINLAKGEYSITTVNTINNQSAVNNITVLTTLGGNDIVKYYKNGTQYYAKFLNGEGNPLTGADVVFNIDGVFYHRTTDENGIAKFDINLRPNEFIITAINPINGEMSSNNITVLSTVYGNDLVKYYRNGSQYFAKFLNSDGTPLINTNVQFNIDGVFYNRVTDENGVAMLIINLRPGKFIITAINPVNGEMSSNTIEVLTILKGEDLNMVQGDGSSFNVKLLDGQGNPLAGKEITFNIDGIFYSRVTDNDGIAKLNINLRAGDFIITSMYNGYSTSNKIAISKD